MPTLTTATFGPLNKFSQAVLGVVFRAGNGASYGISATIRSLAGTALGLNLVTSAASQGEELNYIRVYNLNNFAGRIAVVIRSASTGALLGTWTSDYIQPGASVQYPVSTIASEANVSTSSPIQFTVSSSMAGYLQHVAWNSNLGALRNVSVCSPDATTEVAGGSTLMSVHSTRQSSYPSTIDILPATNGFLLAGNAPATATVSPPPATNVQVRLGIYDARNGTKLGTYTTDPISPLARTSIAMSTIEAAANITPSAEQLYYVIKAEAPLQVVLRHSMRNVQNGSTSDLTAACSFDRVLPDASIPAYLQSQPK